MCKWFLFSYKYSTQTVVKAVCFTKKKKKKNLLLVTKIYLEFFFLFLVLNFIICYFWILIRSHIHFKICIKCTIHSTWHSISRELQIFCVMYAGIWEKTHIANKHIEETSQKMEDVWSIFMMTSKTFAKINMYISF